jgi:hypothetical protein
MKHCMLDLETMGNGPQAAIVAIGAVQFDLAEGMLGDEFYCRVKLRSAVQQGGRMDPDTVLWWLKQSDAARRELTEPTTEHGGEQFFLMDALEFFRGWMREHHLEFVWGNGSDFDNTILSGAYARAEITRPWPYYGNRCYRTLKGLRPDCKPERDGTAHNALDDARTQARHAVVLAQLMGLSK